MSVELNPALLPPGAASAPPGARVPVEGGPASPEGGRAPVPSFADVLKDATGRPSASESPSGPARTGGTESKAGGLAPGVSANALGEGGAGASGALSFSKHALERVQRRGIALDPTTLGRLHEGVGRAAGKGSRDSIVLVDGTAFVVSVPNRTVITAVGSEHMREHVFTNIDSAVIA